MVRKVSRCMQQTVAGLTWGLQPSDYMGFRRNLRDKASGQILWQHLSGEGTVEIVHVQRTLHWQTYGSNSVLMGISWSKRRGGWWNSVWFAFIPVSRCILQAGLGLAEQDYCVVYSIIFCNGISTVLKANWRCLSRLCFCTQAAGSAKNNMAIWDKCFFFVC